ncbi:MAG TPA: M13 family metallopeptidase [Steroidobacteraceae bacterium]
MPGVEDADTAPAPAAAALRSGIELQYFDRGVRPQDDFYGHVNGAWLRATEIPADKGRYGAFDQLADDALEQLRTLVEPLRDIADAGDPDQRKIVDLYASFLDEPELERLGLEPLAAAFERIAALKRRAQIPELIAYFGQIGVGAPYAPRVHQDARDATRYIFDLRQGGLGLPDRDYYLQSDQRLVQIRAHYLRHVETMLGLAGETAAAAQARDIVALETALARSQWTQVENRDPVKTYNRIELAQLPGLAPGHDWPRYLTAAGVAGRIDYLVIGQPSYIAAFDRLLRRAPLAAWRAYFRWRLLSDYAPYLSRRFVDEHFAFYGTALRGIARNRPRWKRAIALLDDALGEALGRIYVARHFPPAHKARMDELVANLLAAYRADIEALEWMGPQTRQKAREKLDAFTSKIGHPSRWRDYGALRILPQDLVGNLMRAAEFEYQRNLGKLGHPIDRGEWEMTPQTVNAYYNPAKNEIVFPAAILQPPFFDAQADDAVNYGGIGAVIGHEISHGFDDQGSQYDGHGNLLSPPGWFTPADLEQFKARTRALVQQYAAFEPVPGFPINGELTLGENIADNAGLAIAYQAYRLSLGGQPAPVIDGLSGEQRFFIGWAQVWRSKTRDNEAILRIKADPHAPPQFRGTVPQMNQAAFHDAFGVRDGDRMYLPPSRRLTLW